MITPRFALRAVVMVAVVAMGILHADFGFSTGPSTKSGQISLIGSCAGPVSCRKCHEKFYQLWASSHHGPAMQPYTAELARKKLSPHTEEIVIRASRYRAKIAGENGWVIERGPEGEKKYRIEHVMRGKNVYYFLTPLDRGRLQTLPVAYHVNKREWFDMAASGVRHVPGQTHEPIDWKDWQYTFNTACYGCHVSQLSTNYDPKTDTYRTVWKEPGINCETCHGPADEHIRVCEASPKGNRAYRFENSTWRSRLLQRTEQRDVLKLSCQGSRANRFLPTRGPILRPIWSGHCRKP